MIDDDNWIDSLACLFQENENDNSTNPNQGLATYTKILDARVSNNQSETNYTNDGTSNTNLAMIAERAQQNTEEIDSELQKTLPDSVGFWWKMVKDKDDRISFWKIPLLNQQTNEQSSFEILGSGSSMTEIDPESSNGGVKDQSNPLKRQCQQDDPCSSKRHKDLENSEFNPALNSLSPSETYIGEPKRSGITTSMEVEHVKKILTFFSKIEETIEIIHKFRYPFVVLNSLKPRILQKKEEICKSNLSLEPLKKRLNELKDNLIAFEPYLKRLWEKRECLFKNSLLKKNNISCIKTLHCNHLHKKGDPNTFEFLKDLQVQYKITQIAIKDTFVDLSKHYNHNIVSTASLEIFESMFVEYIEPTFNLKFISKDEKIPKMCFFRIKFISEKQIYFYYTLNHANHCTGFSSLLFDSRSDELIKALQKHKKHYKTLHNDYKLSISINFDKILSAETRILGIRLSDLYASEGKCWDYILTDEKYEKFMNKI